MIVLDPIIKLLIARQYMHCNYPSCKVVSYYLNIFHLTLMNLPCATMFIFLQKNTWQWAIHFDSLLAYSCTMVHVFCSLYMIRWNAIYAMLCSLQLVTCLMQLIFYFKIELQVVLVVGKCNCKPNCKALVFIIMCSIKSTIGTL